MTIHPGFEHIHPAPNIRSGTTPALLLAYTWESKARGVLAFKRDLKQDLRVLQQGRCCYCRRSLGDDNITHLEHVIEKGSFPEYRFEIKNIGLSCATCNGQKLGAYNHFLKVVKKSVARGRIADPGTRISQVLQTLSPSPTLLPVSNGDYRWVHPHCDLFSEHITIYRGWVYRWNSPKGRRTVKGLNLNALSLLERRLLNERMIKRQHEGFLSLMIGALDELTFGQVADVCSAVANALRQSRR